MSAQARWIAAGLLVVVGIGAYFASRGRQQENALQVRAPQGGAEDAVQDGMADRAGVAQEGIAEQPQPADAAAKPPRDPYDYGETTPVPADLNPQVRSVAAALREKNHPERISVFVDPPKFEAAAYAADPAKYLNTIEPGRVFQPAQPGPGVKRLVALTPYFQRLTQGESVSLKALAPPGAPVTFTSFDLGEFSNRLTSITVAADAEGVAEAKFTGTPGTINNVNILAASPVLTGQVKYVVEVVLPETAAAN